MRNNKGFTLIELLATIMILAVIAGLTITSVLGVLENAKAKTYQTTVRNIETTATVYLKENSSDITFVGTGQKQYQCIKVRHLIDSGYFDNEILKSKVSAEENVEPDDFIYVSRDANTKVVEQAVLLYDNVSLEEYCKGINGSLGRNITFEYVAGWFPSKEVTITYTLSNIKEQSQIEDYKYLYTINGENKLADDFNKKTVTKKVTITSPSSIEAKINEMKDGDVKSSYSKTINISKIDSAAPVIGELPGDTKYEQTKNITVTIEESGASGMSGFDPSDKNLTVKYGWSTSKDVEPDTYKEGILTYTNCTNNTECQTAQFQAYGFDMTGEYYLWVEPTMADIAGNVVEDAVSTGTYKFDNEKPIVNISRKDYNTIDNSKSTDNVGITNYYISTTNEEPGVTANWITETTYDTTGENTYYVWAKDEAGNISDVKSINSYKVTRTEGVGTTLKTLYENANGEEFTETTYVLSGTPIYISSTLKTGYNSLVLKYNEETIKTGTLKTIEEFATITSSATANIVTININKDAKAWTNSKVKIALYKGTTLATAELTATTNANVSFTGIANATYNVYVTTPQSSTLVDSGVDITVKDASTTSEVNYYTLSLDKEAGIASVTGGGVYFANQTVTIKATAVTGYKFGTWEVVSGDSPVSPTSTNTNVTITKATSLKAVAGDSTPPTISYTAFYETDNATYDSGTWTNKQVNTMISAVDDGSGVAKIQYILKDTYDANNNAEWTTFSFNVSELKQNNTTWSGTESWSLKTRNQEYYFRACDNEGNCTAKENFAKWHIKYDLDAPSIPTYEAYHTEDKTNYNSGTWTNRQVSTKISASDSGSGVAKIQYILKTTYDTNQNATWSTFAFNESALTQSNTTWSGVENWTVTNGRNDNYYFRACDKLDNCSTVSNVYNIKYDTGAPTAIITITDCDTFKYSATDNSYAQVDGYYVSTSSTKPTTSSNWITSTSKEIAINTNNTYYIWAKDEAGNISAVSSQNLVQVTRSQGANSTLTTRYNSTNSSTGTTFTSNIYVLPSSSCNVWASATTSGGYDLSLSINDTKVTDPTSATTTVTAKTTIASTATGETYTINYYVGNGTSTVGNKLLGSTTCTYNGTCTLTSWTTLGATFPNSGNGWKFYGWTTDQTSLTRQYTDNQSFTYNQTNNLNLFAIGYRTFNFYSGIAPTSVLSSDTQYWNPYKTTQLTSITIPEPTNINTSWTFVGYRATNDASSTATFKTTGESTPDTDSLTSFDFRSIYSRTLTINYHANGGSGETTKNTVTQYYNSGYAKSGSNSGANITTGSFTLASNNFTKAGSEFSSWADDSVTGKTYAEKASYIWTPTVNSTTVTKTMYALWTANTATITITKDGNAYSGLTVALYQNNVSKYTSPTANNGIYTFSGVANGTYNIYVGGVNTGITVTVNKTGTATIKYFTLSIAAGDNISAVTGEGIYVSDTSVSISATSKTGYTFTNWTYSGNVPTNTALSSTTITINKTTSLTAKAADTSKPDTPTITISDCDTFTYSSSDTVAVTGYYVSTSDATPTASSDWITSTTKSFTIGTTDSTYYVWARDAAGNISPSKSITLVKVSRSQGANTTLTTRYNSTSSSTGTAFTSNIYVLPSNNCQVWASASADTGYSVTLTRNSSAVTNPSSSSVTTATTIASTANDVDKPSTPTITVTDCDTFTYSATDTNGIAGYYVATSNAPPTASSSGWTSATEKSFTVGSTATTYYVWAKDNEDNISETPATISLVKVSRSQGSNSTLTTRYNSTSSTTGTNFTNTIYVLPANSCRVWAQATNNSGYNGTVLTWNETDYGSTAIYTPITVDTVVASSNAVSNTATLKIKKDGDAYSGLTVALYKDGKSKYTNPNYSSGSYSFSTVAADTYDIYINGSDTGLNITVATSAVSTINYYTLTLTKGTGISSVSGTGTYLSGTTVNISATAANCYTFSSWTKSSGSSPASTTSASTTVTIKSKTALTANTTADDLEITFNPNGGSVSSTSKTVTYNGTYGDLPTPTRTNYTFNGWYTSSSSGTKVSANDTVGTCGSQTLYAQWTENVITNLSVTISGSAIVGNTLTAKATSDISGATYTYTWYSNTNQSTSGGSKIGTGNTYTLKDAELAKYIYVEATATADNYTTATAKSNILGPVQKTYTYSVTFYANGATITHNGISSTTSVVVACSDTTTATSGSCPITTLDITAPTNYKVIGWGEEANSTEAVYQPNEVITLNSSNTGNDYYAIIKSTDVTAPVLTVNDFCVKKGETVDKAYLLSKAQATDASGVTVTVSLNSIDTSTVGTKEVTYTATDKSDNKNSVSKKITVTIYKQIIDDISVVTSGDGLYADTFETGRYVYRGANPNNYLTFNDETWRIISIESDGTYKIIYAGDEEILYKYHTSYDGLGTFTNMAINTYLNNTYYNTLLSSAKNLVVSHKFNAGTISADRTATGYYLSHLVTNESNSSVNIKVGLQTLSDYLMASTTSKCYTSSTAINSLYSGCRENNWMNISPSTAQYTMNIRTSSRVWHVESTGVLSYAGTLWNATTDGVIRPVVYLSPSTTVTGSGSSSDPYVINTACSSPSNYTCEVNPESGYDSVQTLTISAKDQSGNVITSGITYSFDAVSYSSANTKDVSSAGTYMAYIKDSSGLTNSCSVTLNSRTEYRSANCAVDITFGSWNYGSVYYDWTCSSYSGTNNTWRRVCTGNYKGIFDCVVTDDAPMEEKVYSSVSACNSGCDAYVTQYRRDCDDVGSTISCNCKPEIRTDSRTCSCNSWGAWSAWGTTELSSSCDTKVETRTAYGE